MSALRQALVGRALSNRKELIENKKDLYGRLGTEPEMVAAFQLERFNSVWSSAVGSIPFYRWWAKENGLPDQVTCLEEIRGFPKLTKKVLQEQAEVIFERGKAYETVSTGGSSGEPTVFITSKEEAEFQYANTYLGRGWSGINPLDPTFLLWGHSHLFGSGFKGQLMQAKRSLFDRLLGIERYDAYNLSDAAIKEYARHLIRLDPIVIIGYTSAVYTLARYIKENRVDLPASRRLKGVVLTSETITANDIKLVQEVFGAPAIIEYGMAETSVIAYSRGDGGPLDVFWDSFVAQADAAGNLSVSTIYPRVFPLINYETSDIVVPVQEEGGALLKIKEVAGRARDNVMVRNTAGGEKPLSGILIVHLIKGYPGVKAVQYRQLEGGQVLVSVQGNEAMDLSAIRTSFRKDLLHDHPGVDAEAVTLEQVASVERTVAGKVKMKLTD